MKTIIIISCLFGVALVEAGVPLLAYPIAYAKFESGAPIGLDGRVVDTPEVAYAKAEHAAAHYNERLTHAAKSSDAVILEPTILKSASSGAPIGVDGRVVDTPEVSLAKAEHAAAHLNEKLRQAPAVITTYASPAIAPAIVSPLPVLTKAQPGAPIGLDGRVVDTPEVAFAKAEHAAAHINARRESAGQELKDIGASNYVYLSSPYIHYYY